MFSRRWSTVSVLCVFALAIVAGFLVGQNPRIISGGASHKLGEQPPSQLARSVTLDSPPITATSERRCIDLFSELPTPARDDALVIAMEGFAERDPSHALKMALTEKNSRLRDRLLDAVFRGWGKTDAAAAADWILSHPENDIDPGTAIASVFKGAVTKPDEAVQLAQQLCSKNPTQARDYGDALIYAFAQDGNFPQAVTFAVNSSDPLLKTEWLAAAYGSWVNYQPQIAAASAMQIEDDQSRKDALNAVITAWGQIDAQGLAAFAEDNLPDGDQKTLALSQATIFWAATDPKAVAQWINQIGSSPDMDSGEAAIATQPQVMQQPLVAISWAETITDPNLRSRTVAAVVETWVLTNPSAAIDFAKTTADLLSDDRSDLLLRIAQ